MAAVATQAISHIPHKVWLSDSCNNLNCSATHVPLENGERFHPDENYLRIKRVVNQAIHVRVITYQIKHELVPSGYRMGLEVGRLTSFAVERTDKYRIKNPELFNAYQTGNTQVFKELVNKMISS
jgi:hypothetical protein